MKYKIFSGNLYLAGLAEKQFNGTPTIGKTKMKNNTTPPTPTKQEIEEAKVVLSQVLAVQASDDDLDDIFDDVVLEAPQCNLGEECESCT